MKKGLLTVLMVIHLAFLAVQVSGQGIRVTGRATDAADGSPLVGVTVQEKGTNNGTITDIDGNFELTVAPTATLVISYVGYSTQEIGVDNRTTINIAMTIGELALQEVVVIGYGTVARRDATGSVASVSSRDFNVGSVSSPQELIVGKVPGVQITTSGGDPTSASRIRIRGGSSMSASNDPLIVIDGVPIDNSAVSGMPNPLSLLNSNDIESFTVLKDASATAIYGSRASNGVILITTKKGLLNRPLAINYDGSVSFGTRTGDIDVLSPEEFRQQVLQQYPEPSAASALLGSAATNWQNEVYQTAVSHDHNLALSGSGFGFLPYRASAGYTNQTGLLKTSGLERITGSLNFNPSFFERHLTLTVNSKYMHINNRFANWGAVGSAMAFDPTQQVYDESSDYGGYFYWRQPSNAPITISTSNPVSQLFERDNRSDVNRLLGNIQLEYLLHFFPDLKATLNLGGDFSGSKGTNIVGESVAWSYDPENGGGENNYYTQNKRNELLDFYLNYKKDLLEINSRLDATAGYSWQHFYREDSVSNSNFSGTRIDVRNLDITENYLVSFFGRVNYVLADKYLLTATLRNDGSSRFSKGTRWGLFPAFAFAWEMSRENFLENVESLNMLKFRIGFGITGQQELGNDYPYLARYTYGQENAQYQFGNQWVTTLRPEGYDVNLKWEETSTFNVGLDFGFLDERITGSVDAYHRTTKDMLNTIPVPAGTNLTNQILTNVGDMINRGFEFALTLRPVVRPAAEWSVTLNGTRNRNEITRLTAVDDPDYVGVFTGGISGGVGNYIQVHTVGYPLSSFYVYEQVYGTDGRPVEGAYVDRNGDGSFTEIDKYRSFSPAPDFFLGLSTSVTWSNLDFGFNGRLNVGNYVYNNMSSNYGSYSELYRSVGFLANLNRSILDTGFDNPQYWSDYYLENATFFRLDNVYLGYTLNPLVTESGRLRLYANVQNLFTLTGYSGLDPEVQDGIDNNIFPRPRTFMFGVNLQF
jgi:TonB-dependent starch-binding outer membrane protein SusC